MNFQEFAAQKQSEFAQKPNEFYAKKFDLNPHILDRNEVGHPSMCGKLGAALGNNYAPLLPKTAHVCTECLKVAFELHLAGI